jgi:hypothetical protein
MSEMPGDKSLVVARRAGSGILRGCAWMLLGSFLTIAIQVVGCVTIFQQTAEILSAPGHGERGDAPSYGPESDLERMEEMREHQKKLNQEREEARNQQ